MTGMAYAMTGKGEAVFIESGWAMRESGNRGRQRGTAQGILDRVQVGAEEVKMPEIVDR